MSDINLNQFKVQQAVGEVDLTFFGGENVMSVLFDPLETSTDTLVPGEGVKLVDLGAGDLPGVPIVAKRTGANDPVFGCVKRSTKKATYSPGDKLEIAIAGCPMVFKGASAVNRGAQVVLVEADPGQVEAIGATKLAPLGIAIDKIASGGLGRVLIQADGHTVGTST